MAIDVNDSYLLPCGHDASILWEHVAAGSLDHHEQACPHCLAAAEGFRALLEATGEYAELDVVPPRDLTMRIMRAVRTERRRDSFLPIGETALGPIRIAAQAAAVVLRFAADQAGGAVARSCSIEPSDADPSGLAGTYVVRLDLALRYGVDGTATVERVRNLVFTAARDLAGFDAERVDITVVDLWQEEA